MIRLYIILIIAAIIIALVVKLLLSVFHLLDDDKPVSDVLIVAGAELILANISSFSDKVIQFLYTLLQLPEPLSESSIQPGWLLGLGAVMLILGIMVKIIDSSIPYVILNMPGTIHHTKDDGMQKSLNATKCEEIEVSTAGSQSEMQKLPQSKLNGILKDIELQMNRFNREKGKKRCFTGMAPIPFIIYAGTKHEGNDIKHYIEFDKSTQKYVKLNNDKSYPQLIVPKTDCSSSVSEIVVSVSTTVRITEADTKQFNLPILNITLDKPKDNAIFSKKQLNDYVNRTVTAISELCKNNDISTIHLLLATQPCFAYALGKSFITMQNRIPQIISYHYIAPSYSVGIIVNGKSRGNIVRP